MNLPVNPDSLPDLINDALKSGWTLSSLATVTGMSQPNVSRLRSGMVSEDSQLGQRLRSFLEADKHNQGYRAVSAVLGRVLARHPKRQNEIMQLILRLDMLLSDAPEPGRRRRGRKPASSA